MRSGLFMLLFCTVLAACGGSASSDDQAPIQQVQAFVAASEARDVDRMIALLAPEDRRDAGWQLRQVMPKVQTLKYVNPQYKLESSDDTTARVLVTGTIQARTVEGQDVEHGVTQVLELVKIDNVWYITGNGVQPPVQ